jgi:hypothetical protein
VAGVADGGSHDARDGRPDAGDGDEHVVGVGVLVLDRDAFVEAPEVPF